MNHLVKQLMTKAKEAATLEGARAFAEAALMVDDFKNARDVILKGYSEGNKISVIKTLREHLHVGLREAKDMSEALPYTIPSLSAFNSERLMEALKGVGATVEVR